MTGTAFEALQYLSLLIVLGTFFLLTSRIKRDRNQRLWAVPMLVWMAHAIVFYIFLLAGRMSLSVRLPNEFYTNWSATLRLHGYLTVFSGELARWIQSKGAHKWTR
jgi:hypothetical protein